MSTPNAVLIGSITTAVESAPEDPVLRLHLAELLLEAGDSTRAIPHLATVLQQDPGSERAQALMGRAVGAPGPAASPAPEEPTPQRAPVAEEPAARVAPAPAAPPAPTQEIPTSPAQAPSGIGFQVWTPSERPATPTASEAFIEQKTQAPPPTPRTTLVDVAGMQPVKDRLEAAFLAPLRNSELRAAFGKSLRGGLLLYGPPGCGKTFLARAVSGEIGAEFITVSLAEVLEQGIGSSERNIRSLFQQARSMKPCVVFLDEVDSLGGRRSKSGGHMRNIVTQLLTELDSVFEDNDGVFLLAATNHPWDVDPALRRPGRLDRMLFVPPPDEDARAAILRADLRDRPVGEVDVHALARRSAGLSGADLDHLCESAAEQALLDSARLGKVRRITMDDFDRALAEVRPSTGDWFESARAVVNFANEDNNYQDLALYLNQRKNKNRFWG